MRNHGEADIAHALRHRRSDLLPLLVRSIDPEDAAVILLVQAIGMTGSETHAVRIVSVLGVGVGKKIGAHAFVEWRPIATPVDRLENATRRHRDIKMLRIARVDQDRVQRRAVGRTLLVIVAPRLALRMLVEAVDSFPRRSAVARTEQTLWRGS